MTDTKRVSFKDEGEMVEWGNKIRDLNIENKKLRDMLKMSYSKFSQCLSDCKKLRKQLYEEQDHSCSLSRMLYEMKDRADPDKAENYIEWDVRIRNYEQFHNPIDDDEAISPMSSGQSSDEEQPEE
jgi:hypothetical protein